MRARTLVLLRHGQTAWNVEQRGQGHHDVVLDERGHAQAAAVAPVMAALRPSVLWSSDLSRARETAAYVAEAAGVDATYDARLREFDLGDRTGLTLREFEGTFPDGYSDFRRGRYSSVPGAESTEQVTTRLTSALREVLDALAPGGCAVVVGHGAALKVSVTAILGWPADSVASMAGLDNCGWAVLEEDSHRDALRLRAWNRTVGGPDFTSASGVG